MSPTLSVSPEDWDAEAFRVKTKGPAKALPIAATLEVLRNCRRDEPIIGKDLEFSIEMLIPLREMQIKGKN
jgi:hypothetical protein